MIVFWVFIHYYYGCIRFNSSEFLGSNRCKCGCECKIENAIPVAPCLKVALKVNASLCAEARTPAGLHTVDSVQERSDESETTGSKLGAAALAGDDNEAHAHVTQPARWLDSLTDASIHLPQ